MRFKLNRDWYKARNIPYRRGYLFHGPAGNGKTSIALALASELGMNVGYIALGDGEIKDASLVSLIAEAQDLNMIIVMEDVDCAFEHRDRNPDGASEGVTFSGLINVLDGLVSPEGQILIMTTNRKAMLDEALTRPGRVDYDLYFGNADAYQAACMVNRFYPDGAPVASMEALVALVENEEWSMAHIQQELIKATGPKLTVEYLKALREQKEANETT